MMNEKERNKKLADYQQQFEDIKYAETMVKSQIASERQNPPRDSAELEIKLSQANTELEAIKIEIEARKTKATELKRRITNMKDDFHNTPGNNRPEAWAELAEKIKPIGEQIIESESAIGALEMRKFSAEEAKEMALFSLQAFKQKLHEKGIEDDPRLKAVLVEKEKLSVHIEKEKAKL